MKPINMRSWDTNGARTTFLIWREDESEDDARSVIAWDARSAVEDWASYDDCHSADYSIVKGDDATVLVRRDTPGAEVMRYVVSGETVAQYTARFVGTETRKSGSVPCAGS